MSEEDKGYRVVDKRFTSGDGDETVEEEAVVQGEPAESEQSDVSDESAQSDASDEPDRSDVSDQSEEAAAEQQAPPLVADVYSIAKWVIGMMAAAAWQYMGVQVNPATGKIEKDLVQARIAIDTVVFLGDKIAPYVDETGRREVRALINDLQVNFVQHRD